jgi:hypothetical protein
MLREMARCKVVGKSFKLLKLLLFLISGAGLWFLPKLAQESCFTVCVEVENGLSGKLGAGHFCGLKHV